MRRIVLALAALALLAAPACAQVQNYVSPTPPAGDSSDRNATTAFVAGALSPIFAACPAHQWIDALASNGITCLQPSIGDLQNIGNNTVVGNVSGGSAAPSQLTGAQTEQILQWTPSGTGAAQKTVDSTLQEDVRTTDFTGWTCDGSTDNTTPLTNAINRAIATTGVLRVLRDSSNGYQCKWNSVIVVQAPDGPHNKIHIVVDDGVQMIWNGAQGGLQFNGQAGNGVAGGRLVPWVQGGYWWPYAAGGGWGVMVLAAWDAKVTDFKYNQQGTTSNVANVVLFDDVFHGVIDHFVVFNCGQAVLLRNASNDISVTNSDIEHCTTEGITSAGNTITATTNTSQGAPSAVLTFASAPGALVGQIVTDSTHAGDITAGTTVASTSGNTVTMSANSASAIPSGDTIQFANSNSSGNQLSNLYLEQLSNSIDINEANDSGWAVSNVFINQGNFLTGSSYDVHAVGSQHTFNNVTIINSTSPTDIKNESTYSQFWNITGSADNGSSDVFFRNHTAAAGTSFCGNYSGTLPTSGFYLDASTAKNNAVCASAIVNGSSAFGPTTNTLSGDVSLNNTANFFDGPSIAQGTLGLWYVSGTVQVTDTASANVNFVGKLWDGTTTISIGEIQVAAANSCQTISLSGFLLNPVGNLRISVKDTGTTTGKISAGTASCSGLGQASTLTAVRIQ